MDILEAIRQDYDQYAKLAKWELVEEYRRYHRVCDTIGMSKDELVTGILIAQYGRKKVRAAFD